MRRNYESIKGNGCEDYQNLSQQQKGHTWPKIGHSEGQKDNERSEDIFVYEFNICFLDNSHIKDILKPHYAIRPAQCWTLADPDGDNTEEEEKNQLMQDEIR